MGIDNTSMISQIGKHYYAGEATKDTKLGPSLMNHSLTARYLDRYKPDIAYLNKYPRGGGLGGSASVTTLGQGLPFILSEVGNLLNDEDVNRCPFQFPES